MRMTTTLAGLCLPALLCAAGSAADFNINKRPMAPRIKDIRSVTEGPKHHSLGMAGNPWDPTGRYLVCFETENISERVAPAEAKVAICIVDLREGKTRRVAEASPWLNFLQWAGKGKIVFNDTVEGKLVGVVLDVDKGQRRQLPRPVAAVSHDGKTAAGLDLDRASKIMAAVASKDKVKPDLGPVRPEKDGLQLIDLETGAACLLLSYEQAFAAAPVVEGNDSQPFFFGDIRFSPDDRRLYVEARYSAKGPPADIHSGAFTIGADGKDLRPVMMPYFHAGAAWGEWADNQRLVIVRFHGKQAQIRWSHLLVTDGKEGQQALAQKNLYWWGYPRCSPDGKWMLTDHWSFYNGSHNLQLVSIDTGEAVSLATGAQKNFEQEKQIGLYPIWSPDGKRVCIDSIHSGSRQLYILEMDMPSNDTKPAEKK